jgi:DNA-binding NarL/FixJ family response regulator
MSVLLIENSEILRKKITELLHKFGIKNVLVFNSAVDALAYTRQARVKFIVLDIGSDWKKNKDVFPSLKERYLSPIIVLSDVSDPYFKKKSLQTGADYFFDRSTEIDEFIDLIKVNVKKGRFFNNVKDFVLNAKSLFQ